MRKFLTTVGAAVVIGTATVATVGCGTIEADIDAAEAVIEDLVKAGPAIKELVEIAREIRKDLKGGADDSGKTTTD